MRDSGNLGALVKEELAAVETYKQALRSVAGKESVGPELRRIEAEHEEALGVLREHMAGLNEKIPGDSGLWAEWAKAIGGAVRILGDRAAIKVLKHGEEHGARRYEDALQDEGLDDEIRRIISSSLLPKTKAHIPVLERLLAAAGR